MRSAAAAIVLAGGSGSRIGAGRNKVYLPLGERTVLGWSLRAFATHPEVGRVILVARADEAEVAAQEAASVDVAVEIVEGGATRQDSEWCGLQRLADRIASGAVDTVLIHDGARPLVSPALISSVLAAARADGGAVPGLLRDDLAAVTPDGTGVRWPPGLGRDDPPADNAAGPPGLGRGDLAAAHNGAPPPGLGRDHPAAADNAARPPGIGRGDPAAADNGGSRPGSHRTPGSPEAPTPPGTDALVAVQTPQGFRAAPLLAAYNRAREVGFVGTDTASCVQRFTDLRVRWVPGDERNLKITYPHDLARAARLVSSVTR